MQNNFVIIPKIVYYEKYNGCPQIFQIKPNHPPHKTMSIHGSNQKGLKHLNVTRWWQTYNRTGPRTWHILSPDLVTLTLPPPSHSCYVLWARKSYQIEMWDIHVWCNTLCSSQVTGPFYMRIHKKHQILFKKIILNRCNKNDSYANSFLPAVKIEV